MQVHILEELGMTRTDQVGAISPGKVRPALPGAAGPALCHVSHPWPLQMLEQVTHMQETLIPSRFDQKAENEAKKIRGPTLNRHNRHQ